MSKKDASTAAMTEIVNQQRKVPINERTIALFADKTIRAVAETGNRMPVIAFVDDKEMSRLNLEFRKKDSTTDVLSFRYMHEDFESSETLGDIVISAEQAAKQAVENGLTTEQEIKQLVLHGVLHLCGYDHETDSGEMDSRELVLREALEILY